MVLPTKRYVLSTKFGPLIESGLPHSFNVHIVVNSIWALSEVTRVEIFLSSQEYTNLSSRIWLKNIASGLFTGNRIRMLESRFRWMIKGRGSSTLKRFIQLFVQHLLNTYSAQW